MSCSITTTARAGDFKRAISSTVRAVLVIGHARDRFVEQDHMRIRDQQHADLEPLLLPMRKRAGKPPLFGSKANRLQDLIYTPVLFCLQARADHVRIAVAIADRQFEVLAHQQRLENARF